MPTETLVPITLNGEPHDVPAGRGLGDVLRHAGLDPERPGVAVALGDRVVPRKRWAETTVRAGDTLEVITATQGG